MAGQVGWKSEGTWGTGVVVDTFVPVTGASLNIDEGYIRDRGIRAGRRTPNPARLGARKVSGNVALELPNVSLATLMLHMFGAVNTTGDGPYTHTFTPGAHLNKSLTLQVGIEDAGGTVRAFTATGAKIGGWSISCNVGELAQLSVDWTGRDVVTDTALATASYAAGLTPFIFTEGSISVNGSPVASANAVTLTASKGLSDSRHVLGSRYIRQQLESQHFEFSSQITADFDDLTLFNLGPAATQVASVLTFSNGTQSLTITTSGKVVGDPPSLSGIGLEPQTIKLDHSSATSDANTITAVLVNAETSAA
jgi:hypothetical protein